MNIAGLALASFCTRLAAGCKRNCSSLTRVARRLEWRARHQGQNVGPAAWPGHRQYLGNNARAADPPLIANKFFHRHETRYSEIRPILVRIAIYR